MKNFTFQFIAKNSSPYSEETLTSPKLVTIQALTETEAWEKIEIFDDFHDAILLTKVYVVAYGLDCDGYNSGHLTKFHTEAQAKKSAHDSNEWSDGLQYVAVDELQAAEYAADYFKEALFEKIKGDFFPGISLRSKFHVHGVYTVSNSGGYEVQVSNDGSMARLRDAYGAKFSKVSKWFEIEYITDEEGESIPTIDPNGYNVPLNKVMKVRI